VGRFEGREKSRVSGVLGGGIVFLGEKLIQGSVNASVSALSSVDG